MPQPAGYDVDVDVGTALDEPLLGVLLTLIELDAILLTTELEVMLLADELGRALLIEELKAEDARTDALAGRAEAEAETEVETADVLAETEEIGAEELE